MTLKDLLQVLATNMNIEVYDDSKKWDDDDKYICTGSVADVKEMFYGAVGSADQWRVVSICYGEIGLMVFVIER